MSNFHQCDADASSDLLCPNAVTSLFESDSQPTFDERRRHSRKPCSQEITVQPLDHHMAEVGQSFFAITRDVSAGGLSFVSSFHVAFDSAVISVPSDESRRVVCRICGCNLIAANEYEEVYLTNVEFLYETSA